MTAPVDGPAPETGPGLDLLVALPCLDVTAAVDALHVLAGHLLDTGAVTDGFPAALLAREQQYPTGLPTPIPTAIPHADPEHVRTPGLALATLHRPVPFGQMGGSGTVDVQLVVMPLLSDAASHLAALQRLMHVLRDETTVAALIAAQTELRLRALAAAALRPAG